jgi:hypothetical protein
MPPPPDSISEGPGLIEPEQPAPTVDLNSLDTHRILRDTGSLQIPDLAENKDSSETSVTPGTSEDGAADSAEAPAAEESVGEQVRSGLNILSVISLVLALTLSPFAMIFGYLAVGQIRRAQQRGEALAWVSVGLGWLSTVGWVVLAVTLGATWLQL